VLVLLGCAVIYSYKRQRRLMTYPSANSAWNYRDQCRDIKAMHVCGINDTKNQTTGRIENYINGQVDQSERERGVRNFESPYNTYIKRLGNNAD
jgi:hypothetical protein